MMDSRVNYFDVQRLADELGLDYNKVCAAFRRATIGRLAPSTPPAAALTASPQVQGGEQE